MFLLFSVFFFPHLFKEEVGFAKFVIINWFSMVKMKIFSALDGNSVGFLG